MHDEMLKHAMSSVLSGMGQAAKEARARRFTGKKKPMVEVAIGEANEPAPPESDVEVDPVMDSGSLMELEESLEGER